MAAPRVLIGILVYNGRDFVPRCVESAARLTETSRAEVRTLVLDDCSPDEEFAADLRVVCEKLDVDYYRSPRNIGIPRNMTLAMLTAIEQDYDYVVIANSDAIFPANLIDGMVDAAERHPACGSVTSFGNDVSIFSLPNDHGARWLASTEQVDEISAILGDEFAGESVEIPTGVGFCMLVPTKVVREIGTMDPLYGRGYCEEVDWCLRSHAAGYRSLLAPGVFSYHMGSATTKATGMVSHHTTVWAHERIVDMRYPNYRHEIDTFIADGVLARTQARAFDAIVAHAVRTHGWRATFSAFEQPDTIDDALTIQVQTGGPVVASWRGFTRALPIEPSYTALRDRLGRDAIGLEIKDISPAARSFRREAERHGVPVTADAPYPERV